MSSSTLAPLSTMDFSYLDKYRRPASSFTEEEIRRNLEILNDIPRPFSPTLPPSPPSSRSSSPASVHSKGAKRKYEQVSTSADTPSTTKRAKTDGAYTSTASATPNSRHDSGSSTSPPSPQSGHPSPPADTPPPAPQFTPARIRRGRASKEQLDTKSEKLNKSATTFKRLGLKRLNTAIGRTPTPSSWTPQQIKRHIVIGLMEQAHGVIEFTFMAWLGEQRDGTQHAGPWASLKPLLHLVVSVWKKHARHPKELIFAKYMIMLESAVKSRQMRPQTDNQIARMSKVIAEAKTMSSTGFPSPASSDRASLGAALSPPSRATPISNGNTPLSNASGSSGSTGQLGSNGVGDLGIASRHSRTNSGHHGSPHSHALSPQSVSEDGRIQLSVEAAEHIREALEAPREQRSEYNAYVEGINLPTLYTHFPKTFARTVMPTSGNGNQGNLKPSEEYEIRDLEEEEQAGRDFPFPATLDGIVWVLLLGRAMLGELLDGRDDVGVYRGLEGCGKE